MSIHSGRDTAVRATAKGPVWRGRGWGVQPLKQWVVQPSSVAPETSIVMILRGKSPTTKTGFCSLEGHQNFHFLFRLLKHALDASGFPNPLALSHISIGYRAQRTPLRRGGKTWKMVAQTFFDVTFRWENKLRTPLSSSVGWRYKRKHPGKTGRKPTNPGRYSILFI